jgi:hypothetical protein
VQQCGQGGGEAVHLGADVVILLAESGSVRQAFVRARRILSRKRMELALGKRDGLAPVLRMRHRELGEELMVLS